LRALFAVGPDDGAYTAQGRVLPRDGAGAPVDVSSAMLKAAAA